MSFLRIKKRRYIQSIMKRSNKNRFKLNHLRDSLKLPTKELHILNQKEVW
jgi:hypothetical protein